MNEKVYVNLHVPKT